jgi:hypothetical protein
MLWLLRVVALLVGAAAAGSAAMSGEISRDDFPKSFVFGAGTSAYQVSLQYDIVLPALTLSVKRRRGLLVSSITDKYPWPVR